MFPAPQTRRAPRGPHAMRISLLQQREPFAQILEATLAAFWSEQGARATRVTWHRGTEAAGPEVQRWYANIYLNAIFVPSVESSALTPVCREFGRSPKAWRRPWQHAYVAAATSRRGRRWLSQAVMDVSPPVPEAQQLLIVPGNQKIRLLHRRQGTSTCILKSGWETGRLAAELAVRRQVEQLGLPVPRLLSAASDGRWYQEAYICGTPLNRVAAPAERRRATGESLEALRHLVAETQQHVASGTYLDGREAHIRSDLERIRPRHARLAADIDRAVQDLLFRLRERSETFGSLTVSLTHGDFQAANILLADRRLWLIDWEDADLRPSLYDPLVLAMQSRCGSGLGRRLRQFVRHPADVAALPLSWPGVRWATWDERAWQAELFLLEEWAWHLRENARPPLLRIRPGLAQLLHEWQVWRKTTQSSPTTTASAGA